MGTPIKVPCPGCNHVVAVEIPDQLKEKVVVKEPCQCGLQPEHRIIRYVLTGIVCLILATMSYCMYDNHNDTEQIKMMSWGKYVIYDNREGPFDGGPFKLVNRDEVDEPFWAAYKRRFIYPADLPVQKPPFNIFSKEPEKK